ncbi:hypothetical protein ACFIJ5_16370 [Haloimpatiens sp. FM7330]|uniref:hypothetical protein n=1 Tax=Haloimpatiens sp. FM7330 TaxID=3298610 RepID=UPI00363F7F4E
MSNKRDKLDMIDKLHEQKIHKLKKRASRGKEQSSEEFKEKYEQEEKYIKEMREMELKRELRDNTIMGVIVGSILILCLVIGIKSISYAKKTSDSNKVAVKQEQKVDAEEDSKDTNKGKEEDKKEPKIKYNSKIFTSLSHEADRKKILSNALSANGGKYSGLNIKLMVTILRTNGVNVPKNISRTDTLVKELEKLGWKKNTNYKEMQKGDIVFTTDTVGISGVPSHSYIFMLWENSKKENGYIVDALQAKQGVTYHKRNISVQSETADKLQFFMRKE